MINNLPKIKEKSKELDTAIENGENIEIILQRGVEIDQLIAACIRCKQK